MALQPGVSFYEAAVAILRGLGAPLTTVGVNLLVAWSYCEKPHPNGAWQWNNPLNTEEPGYGDIGDANSDGVKMYATQADGVAATVATLSNGDYPALVQALRAGNAAQFFSAPGQVATWGTSFSCIRTDYSLLGPVPTQFLSPTAAPITATPACPPGFTAVDGVCVPACPSGYTWVNGACVPVGSRPLVTAAIGTGLLALLVAAAVGTAVYGADPAGVRREAARVREWTQTERRRLTLHGR